MYQNFVSMNIAIIGGGKMAETLAFGFIGAGHKVFFGIQEESLISNSDIYNYRNVEVCSIEDAGSAADIVIMACNPNDVRAFAYFLEDVQRKVIIDCTGNTPDAGWLDSIKAIRKITGSAHVVKCSLSNSYNKKVKSESDYVRMYIAGDSKKAKMVADILSRDLGVNECYDFGGNGKVSLLENMAQARKKAPVAA